MRVIHTELPGVVIFQPDAFGDPRGFFMETFHREKYRALGLDREFVQDNFSHSCARTLRGLHYQWHQPQAKLVTVLHGAVFDVAVDIRRGSPTFGRWIGLTLSRENHKQLFIPEGFAHGFCVLSERVDFIYKCTAFYDPSDERGLLWNDPAVGIDWPISEPLLSARDVRLPLLADVPESELPIYHE